MSIRILSVILVGLTTCQTALADKGYYEYLQYYNNDPFTFCTVGVPEDCWAPIDAATGTFTVTNQYCFNPVSAATFARVCPRAFNNVSSGTDSVSTPNDPADASP
ncbi:hypothetical protein [Dyella sp. GSA-30]|uniref:hypothetical protein n=1 Tax=Dyella sp. GSA-30 TaxID=2994496 RepID=UPI002491F182|nr:hypothetical protein [Dyella sp. GSA-30]BDU23248.1 hypothetical protein DYGSA30_47050 [Dyella sp. GSA-30]